MPAFALPCFCGCLGWAKFLLLRWRTLAHYRGSQSKMCQGIKCLSEKHLQSPASSPANGCTCLGFMCALFVCPSATPSLPGAPLSWLPAWASLIPFFQQHSCFLWEKQWPKRLRGGQRAEGEMPSLTSALQLQFLLWKKLKINFTCYRIQVFPAS